MVARISDSLAEHVYNGGFIHCKDIHPNGCIVNAGFKFTSVFRAALKFYIPLHVVPVLLFKRRGLMEE